MSESPDVHSDIDTNAVPPRQRCGSRIRLILGRITVALGPILFVSGHSPSPTCDFQPSKNVASSEDTTNFDKEDSLLDAELETALEECVKGIGDMNALDIGLLGGKVLGLINDTTTTPKAFQDLLKSQNPKLNNAAKKLAANVLRHRDLTSFCEHCEQHIQTKLEKTQGNQWKRRLILSFFEKVVSAVREKMNSKMTEEEREEKNQRLRNALANLLNDNSELLAATSLQKEE